MDRRQAIAALWGARAAFWRERAGALRDDLDEAGAAAADAQRDWAVRCAGHFGGTEHEHAPEAFPPWVPHFPRRSAAFYLVA